MDTLHDTFWALIMPHWVFSDKKKTLIIVKRMASSFHEEFKINVYSFYDYAQKYIYVG